jgi:lysophospholipase L1-like esterase
MDYGWRLLSKTLETMNDYAGQAGAQLYVVFIPFEFQSSEILYERSIRKHGQDPSEFDLEKPNRKLAQLCESLEIAYLDLLPAVKEAVSNGYKLYFIRDGHLNVDGHNFAAKEIYKDLKDRWLEPIENQ